MNFLSELAARQRFGVRPGLGPIRTLAAALGNPQVRFPALHVAGTNGKGAVTAILDAALRADGLRVGRYTSPHLVKLNERFFLDGHPLADADLDRACAAVGRALVADATEALAEITFFEALTAAAFIVYAEARPDYAVLECGLGGRLDATNICVPKLCVITRIGLDHCDWLGETVEKIAAEKAGIIKPGVPVVLGRNADSVRAVVEARARELGAPFFYAPDLADEADLPSDFSLAGRFNRENAVTALAALRVLGHDTPAARAGFARIVWPGRFQRVGRTIVDGAHNPPAATALAAALGEAGIVPGALALVAGFCGDKDCGEVLRILSPYVKRGYAVRIGNPRALSPEAVADAMRAAGLEATPCASLPEALRLAGAPGEPTLVAGSLFLAGEALVALGAYPWDAMRFDPSEQFHPTERKQPK